MDIRSYLDKIGHLRCSLSCFVRIPDVCHRHFFKILDFIECFVLEKVAKVFLTSESFSGG